ncbi:hypothetical protein QUF63_03315 [Anaerolineales bacterium HSG25]|nr:hypothetical protein [Anaerolineales bacterium HSG25]
MQMQANQDPAYITIVEGPPPDFREVNNNWSLGVLESHLNRDVALCEMRTFDGPKMVDRCEEAWREGRLAKLDFPDGEGGRIELDILAIRWEDVSEGHKLHLWVNI